MQSKALLSVFYTLITIILVNLILAGMAWIVGWPSIDSTTLFFLGITTMILSYLLDASLFGKSLSSENAGTGAFEQAWRYRWRKYIYTYPTNSKRESGADQFESEGNLSTEKTDPEFEKARSQSALLINISLAGAVAAVLSFILPHLF